MKICKWAGDMGDEYCKNCNGVTMDIDGNSTSCTECAGYEAGDEDVQDEFMNVPEEELPFEPDEETNKEKSVEKPNKTEKSTNNTDVAKNVKIDVKDKEKSNENTPIKVSEEKKVKETTDNTPNGIQVTSLRYTSSATVKKGDNYFKFTAEEEWDVSRIEDVQDAREQLWAKLNGEVDSQIEELNSMN